MVKMKRWRRWRGSARGGVGRRRPSIADKKRCAARKRISKLASRSSSTANKEPPSGIMWADKRDGGHHLAVEGRATHLVRGEIRCQAPWSGRDYIARPHRRTMPHGATRQSIRPRGPRKSVVYRRPFVDQPRKESPHCCRKVSVALLNCCASSRRR